MGDHQDLNAAICRQLCKVYTWTDLLIHRQRKPCSCLSWSRDALRTPFDLAALCMLLLDSERSCWATSSLKTEFVPGYIGTRAR
eukprot:2094919-Amphidinium_carterae.1